jgi:hypothetical protein
MRIVSEPTVAAATKVVVHPEKDAKINDTPTSFGNTIKAEAVNTPKESKIDNLKRKLMEIKMKVQGQKVSKKDNCVPPWNRLCLGDSKANYHMHNTNLAVGTVVARSIREVLGEDCFGSSFIGCSRKVPG